MNYETTVSSERGDQYTADPYANGLEGVTPVSAKRRNRRIALVALVVLVLAALAYFLIGGSDKGAVPAEDSEDQAPLITVTSPGNGTIAGEIATTGTLAARRALPVGVAGEGGRVVSVPVDAGQWVNAGQVLAVIDRSVQNQQAASASAQVQVAQADANLAQANLARALKLVERGFISTADVDRLTATRDAANARVRVANAQAGELRARNARLNIVAPSGGLLLERNVEPGQVVSAGSGTLFLIAKGGEMELLASVGEVELTRIGVGTQAQVIPVGTEKVFTGQVWQIAPTIDAQNRQGTARISLPYSPELRPGGFASAVIKSGSVVAPMLPESAILSDDTGSFVYIIDKANKVVRRPIKTGLVTNDGIAIIEGLSGTEKVVLRAGGFLNVGDTVKTKVADRPSAAKPANPEG
ncbi:efflux RND transporter periplasmic adaptor subunit [Altererythrobacter confluentis]|uniref:Efflux RND transporter periplasmic adaptor subunit n=1 Tax=Allopontixanthobacter confluentis TaxID=1849021 RepID=A0A6L7GJN0_9SPHN|nr:efflux RND transporter periplasmic adaptor subunit [Allopontixanthobacter confluentis]MXP15128.1 efflux RND transporter periplasmic adaptor subunit [Allopontixanthobacter confluentis]